VAAGCFREREDDCWRKVDPGMVRKDVERSGKMRDGPERCGEVREDKEMFQADSVKEKF
jgi:hypothetical protein